MAIELGTAYISVVPETNKLASGITGELKKAEGGADAAGRGVGGKFGAGFKTAAVVGVAAIGAAGIGAVAGLKSAVTQASALGESVNAVNVVFGEASEGILQLSKDAARSVGLSQVEFNGLAVRFSSFAQTVAGEGGNVTATLDDLTTRAADFASVMNLEVADAAGVFQSALAGETEPIRQFGIDLSAAAVNAFAAANGIGTLGAELTEQEKVQARYGLLMQETAVAQGDFANTSDSLANRQRILGATFDDIRARIGEALLPTVERLAGFLLNSVIPTVERLVQEFEAGRGPIFAVSEVFRNNVFPALVAVAGFIRNDVSPVLAQLRDRFVKDVMPRLREVADYLTVTFRPTFQALVDLYRNNLQPAIEQITAKFRENEPQTRKVQAAVAAVASTVFFLYTQYLSFLLPMLIRVAGFLINTFVVAFRTASDVQARMVDLVGDLVSGFRSARDFAGGFIDKLEDIKVPKPLRDIADLMDRVGGSISGAASGVGSRIRDAVGDISGSFRGTSIGSGGGGNALATIRSILPPGLTITSTYRSPAKNRAVGGSPTSLHMDANNPAVDIGGPTALLDRFAAVLAGLPHRQLLWRTKGHFDHIHFAHTGAKVDASWGTMPGLRSDERPVITQTGERILSRSQTAEYEAGRGISVGTIVAADPRAAVREMRLELALAEALDSMRSVA